MADKAS